MNKFFLIVSISLLTLVSQPMTAQPAYQVTFRILDQTHHYNPATKTCYLYLFATASADISPADSASFTTSTKTHTTLKNVSASACSAPDQQTIGTISVPLSGFNARLIKNKIQEIGQASHDTIIQYSPDNLTIYGGTSSSEYCFSVNGSKPIKANHTAFWSSPIRPAKDKTMTVTFKNCEDK
jgi:hypothetical protein